jgi:hypothetical protein
MSDRMSTNIEDIMDPNLSEIEEVENNLVRCPPEDIIRPEQAIVQQAIVQQPVKPDLKVKNPNVSNIKANVSVQKTLTDTFFTESNILLIIIIIIAGLPQTNNVMLQIIPKNFQNDILINVLKAIILCVIYVVIINYLL